VVATETFPAILGDYAELPDRLGYIAAMEKEHGDVVYEIARQDWRSGGPGYQPSSRNRSSPMPKWWATSWMTVLRTCSSASH